MRGLSTPPSIEQRIRAAIADEYPYQVVYYNRIEGASTTILDIAKNNDNIVVLGVSVMSRFYNSVDFRSCHSRVDKLEGVNVEGKIFITDVIPDKLLNDWRRELLSRGAKLIAVKGIRTDE